MKKDARLLRIGILGCGPIAQIAHFDACRKARNAELYAVCDVAEDLLSKAKAVHELRVSYPRYDDMLADPQVEAVIIAVADQFHMSLALQAVAAGKHVLVEKPLGVSVEECEELRRALQVRAGFPPAVGLSSSGLRPGESKQEKPVADNMSNSAGWELAPPPQKLVFQIGHNRRFDPGVAFARKFIQEELGQMLALKAWYCDSTHRYTMTDNLQSIRWSSSRTRRPDGNPKADKRRYFLLTHGSHLVDSARFLGGEMVSVRARLSETFGAFCWFVEIEFANGALGHLDLTIPICGDFEEGFQIYGEHGSVKGHGYLPWYHKASAVECFSEKDRTYRRPLGEDAHTYKRQIEGFVDTILHGKPQLGANIDDGLAAMRALVAIARSVESGSVVRLDKVQGGV